MGKFPVAKTDDRGGTKYVIHGISADGHTEIGVVDQFKEIGRYLIITAYEIFD